MKKHHITALIAGAMITAGFLFSSWNEDFWMGIISGIGIVLALTVTVGQWLAGKATERIDKLNRDRIEENDNG